MLIKQLNTAEVVQPERCEAGLLRQLACSSAGRLFSRLEVPVDALPGSRTAPAHSTPERQAFKRPPAHAEHIDVHQRGPNRAHGRMGFLRNATAARVKIRRRG